MTRVEALDTAINLLEDYLSGSPDADENFEEAKNVLKRIRYSIKNMKK